MEFPLLLGLLATLIFNLYWPSQIHAASVGVCHSWWNLQDIPYTKSELWATLTSHKKLVGTHSTVYDGHVVSQTKSRRLSRGWAWGNFRGTNILELHSPEKNINSMELTTMIQYADMEVQEYWIQYYYFQYDPIWIFLFQYGGASVWSSIPVIRSSCSLMHCFLGYLAFCDPKLHFQPHSFLGHWANFLYVRIYLYDYMSIM